jgi:hypothetical protein
MILHTALSEKPAKYYILVSISNRNKLMHFRGLKGPYNSAQGKVSGGTNRNAAPGKGNARETVRED